MLGNKLQVLRKTIEKLLRKRAHRRLVYIIEKVHPADLAVIFRFLSDEHQQTVFHLLPTPAFRAQLLENLDDAISRDLLADYSVSDIADMIGLMSTDDAADIIQNMGEDKVAGILALLNRDDREELNELIGYQDDTAGGLMVTDFIALPAHATARQALDVIQKMGDEAEMVFYIYAVDEDDRLEGVASLREIVQADDAEPLENFMETDIHKVRVDMDQEEVARIIARYDLLAVPVVDNENRMIGIVTVDDVIDVIREENTEDMLRMVGTDEDLLEDYSVKRNIISRFPWLLATWFGGLAAMKLIGAFEDQLSQVVALTAFFPIILGMSGNVGQQSATIIVRGLAIGKVDVHHLAATVGKEALTGLVIGVLYGLALAGAAWVEFGDKVAMIPLVVGLSQAFGMTLAAVMGAFTPMALSRLKIDPAVATGPLVTTSLDLLGMGIYILFAMLLIF